MARFSRALTGVCLITLFLLVSSQDADAAKKAKKVKADETITNKVREAEKKRSEEEGAIVRGFNLNAFASSAGSFRRL